jgi:hypothetical protein
VANEEVREVVERGSARLRAQSVLYSDDAKKEVDAALEVVRKLQLQTVDGI